MTGRVRSRTAGILVSLLVAHAVLVWLARDPGFLTREDDVEYAALGQSLRDLGYNEMHRVGEPGHSQYPPAYPAMLAVWGAVFGDGFDALTALTVMLSVASLLIVFLLMRRVLGEVLALMVTAILALNPHIVHYAGAVLSETPYVFLTVLALYLLQRGRPGKRHVLAVSAIALGAALTRSAGVTFVAAIIVYWLSERRYRAAFGFAAVSGLALGAWFLWTTLAPEQFVGASYVADLTADGQPAQRISFAARLSGNIWWYGRTGIPWTLAVPTVRGTWIDNAVSLLVVTVAALAGLRVFARRWRVGFLYALAYAGLLAVWVWNAERFILPVLFLLVAALLGGAFAIGSRWGERWGFRTAGAIAAILLLSGFVRTASLVAGKAGCRVGSDGLPPAACIKTDQASFFDAVRWIRENTAPEAVVLAAKGSPLWHYTRRQHIGYRAALAQPPAEFLDHVRDQGADYILLGSLQFRELDDLSERMAAACSRLTVAAYFPTRTWLFSLQEPETAAAAEASCAAVMEHRNLNQGRDFQLDR